MRFSRFASSIVFLVLLTSGATIAEAQKKIRQHTWSEIERIVAVGDVHGDHGQFLKTLLAAKVIDKEGRWIGGKTHLVQTGDLFDRGPDSRKTMDLLMKLEVKGGPPLHIVSPMKGASACAGRQEFHPVCNANL